MSGIGLSPNRMLASPGAHVILKQFYLNCLAHASYLVGEVAGSIAAWEAAKLPVRSGST